MRIFASLSIAVLALATFAGQSQTAVGQNASAQVALTPPMGWNSWNFFAGKVTDKDIRAPPTRLVATGMKDAGYVYVNIDDTWEGERDAQRRAAHQREVPRHESAGRLCTLEGAEDRHLFLAWTEDLRRL